MMRTDTMSSKVFFRQLGILTLLTAVAVVPFQSLSHFCRSPDPLLGFARVLFPVGGSPVFMGKKLAASENRNALHPIRHERHFFKMLLSMSVLVVYLKFAAPESKYFILPFLTVYLAFTVFETYFLMKIAKIKPDGKA
ncbi:MAG: hypothetical protein IPH04_20460 [Saprospirales bacterium]|nr:hypothetical protein [Saprospirales bacterium]